MNNRIFKLILLLITLAFMVFRLGLLSGGFRESMHDKPLKPAGIGTIGTTHFSAKYIREDSCSNGEIYTTSLVFTKGRREGMATFKNISNEVCDLALPFLYQIYKDRWIVLNFSTLPQTRCELSCLLRNADTNMPSIKIGLGMTDIIINESITRYFDLQGYQGLIE